MFIYAITNDVNDKAYVGLHCGIDLRTRWITHRSFSKRGSNSLISLAMRKHGIEKFHITSVWSGHISLAKLKALERYYIQCFGSRVPNGYNLTEGGDGTPGFRHSEEERKRRRERMKAQIISGNIPSIRGQKKNQEVIKKMVASRRGKKNKKRKSEEERKRIGQQMKGNRYMAGYKWSAESIAKRTASRAGYKHSEETRRKIAASNSISMKGKKHSEETKRKMSASHKLRRVV